MDTSLSYTRQVSNIMGISGQQAFSNQKTESFGGTYSRMGNSPGMRSLSPLFEGNGESFSGAQEFPQNDNFLYLPGYLNENDKIDEFEISTQETRPDFTFDTGRQEVTDNDWDLSFLDDLDLDTENSKELQEGSPSQNKSMGQGNIPETSSEVSKESMKRAQIFQEIQEKGVALPLDQIIQMLIDEEGLPSISEVPNELKKMVKGWLDEANIGYSESSQNETSIPRQQIIQPKEKVDDAASEQPISENPKDLKNRRKIVMENLFKKYKIKNKKVNISINKFINEYIQNLQKEGILGIQHTTINNFRSNLKKTLLSKLFKFAPLESFRFKTNGDDEELNKKNRVLNDLLNKYEKNLEIGISNEEFLEKADQGGAFGDKNKDNKKYHNFRSHIQEAFKRQGFKFVLQTYRFPTDSKDEELNKRNHIINDLLKRYEKNLEIGIPEKEFLKKANHGGVFGDKNKDKEKYNDAESDLKEELNLQGYKFVLKTYRLPTDSKDEELNKRNHILNDLLDEYEKNLDIRISEKEFLEKAEQGGAFGDKNKNRHKCYSNKYKLKNKLKSNKFEFVPKTFRFKTNINNNDCLNKRHNIINNLLDKYEENLEIRISEKEFIEKAEQKGIFKVKDNGRRYRKNELRCILLQYFKFTNLIESFVESLHEEYEERLKGMPLIEPGRKKPIFNITSTETDRWDPPKYTMKKKRAKEQNKKINPVKADQWGLLTSPYTMEKANPTEADQWDPLYTTEKKCAKEQDEKIEDQKAKEFTEQLKKSREKKHDVSDEKYEEDGIEKAMRLHDLEILAPMGFLNRLKATGLHREIITTQDKQLIEILIQKVASRVGKPDAKFRDVSQFLGELKFMTEYKVLRPLISAMIDNADASDKVQVVLDIIKEEPKELELADTEILIKLKKKNIQNTVKGQKLNDFETQISELKFSELLEKYILYINEILENHVGPNGQMDIRAAAFLRNHLQNLYELHADVPRSCEVENKWDQKLFAIFKKLKKQSSSLQKSDPATMADIFNFLCKSMKNQENQKTLVQKCTQYQNEWSLRNVVSLLLEKGLREPTRMEFIERLYHWWPNMAKEVCKGKPSWDEKVDEIADRNAKFHWNNTYDLAMQDVRRLFYSPRPNQVTQVTPLLHDIDGWNETHKILKKYQKNPQLSIHHIAEDLKKLETDGLIGKYVLNKYGASSVEELIFIFKNKIAIQYTGKKRLEIYKSIRVNIINNINNLPAEISAKKQKLEKELYDIEQAIEFQSHKIKDTIQNGGRYLNNPKRGLEDSMKVGMEAGPAHKKRKLEGDINRLDNDPPRQGEQLKFDHQRFQPQEEKKGDRKSVSGGIYSVQPPQPAANSEEPINMESLQKEQASQVESENQAKFDAFYNREIERLNLEIGVAKNRSNMIGIQNGTAHLPSNLKRQGKKSESARKQLVDRL